MNEASVEECIQRHEKTLIKKREREREIQMNWNMEVQIESKDGWDNGGDATDPGPAKAGVTFNKPEIEREAPIFPLTQKGATVLRSSCKRRLDPSYHQW